MTTKRNVPTARTAKGLTTPEVILYYRNKRFATYAVLQQNGKSWYLSQQSLFPLDNRKKGAKVLVVVVFEGRRSRAGDGTRERVQRYQTEV